MFALKVHKLCLVKREAQKEQIRKERKGNEERKQKCRRGITLHTVCDAKTEEEEEEIYMQGKETMPGNNENQYT